MRTAVLLLFITMTGGCTPQQGASLMPMMGMGTSLTTQAANLYFEQERIQLSRPPSSARNSSKCTTSSLRIRIYHEQFLVS